MDLKGGRFLPHDSPYREFTMHRLTFCFAFFLTIFAVNLAHADLVASLHIDNDGFTDIFDVSEAGPMSARSTPGGANVANTVGLLSGDIRFLQDASETISDFRAFSTSTVLIDTNRFGANSNGGAVMTWDFNFAGQTFDTYEFVFDYQAEGGKTANNTIGFFLSYDDGAALTLDNTDITTQTSNRGGNNLVVNNTGEYASLLSVDPASSSGVLSLDITAQVNDAIANGGGLRIALVDNSFRNRFTILNNSGINGFNSVPEPTTTSILVLLGLGMAMRRSR